MKLFVDDTRAAPDDWLLVRSVAEAKTLLAGGDVIAISLDHDMGACEACTTAGTHIGDQTTDETTYYNTCPHAETGYDLVMWMIEHDYVPALVAVHSMNPVGRKRMIQALEGRERC